MEEASELSKYLPLSFKTRSEQDYIAFLWDAFESNYTHGKYQFAFLAYHMLTMSFVYFNIWQIKQTEPKDFEKAMVGFNKDLEKELLKATSPFTFWRVNESSVLRFFKLIGCDNDKVGKYAALVKERNDTAHANGNIFRLRSMPRSPRFYAWWTKFRPIPSPSSSTVTVSSCSRTTIPRSANILKPPTSSARCLFTKIIYRKRILKSAFVSTLPALRINQKSTVSAHCIRY